MNNYMFWSFLGLISLSGIVGFSIGWMARDEYVLGRCDKRWCLYPAAVIYTETDEFVGRCKRHLPEDRLGIILVSEREEG